MNINQLYTDLCDSYSDENLNRITAKIIELYKAKNHDSIFQLANIVAGYGLITAEENVARCFSKLLMIYHPDRGNHYRTAIKQCYDAGNAKQLNVYAHILEMNNIENMQVVYEPDYEDIDYNPEYVWDYDIYDQNSFHDTDEENLMYTEQDEDDILEGSDISFFEAMKRKIYGNIDIDLPPYFLEDLDELEMADYELNNLDGIEYCKYLVKLDLSGNKLFDLNGLHGLNRLEELYVNENELTTVDICSRLKRLRLLDIAHNQVEDISYLSGLNNLEYVNLVGNPVPAYQVEQLREQGVIVII
ncbi:MAG: leucine-rich repeat domain-containing protein [Bacteroidota bacterium]